MSEKKLQTIESFYQYLHSILDLYTDVIEILKEELECIEKDNLEKLDEVLKKKQAVLFKTKTFDKKVSEYQDKLGISANSLTQMIPMLPEESRLKFYGLVGQFGKTIDQVNFYKEKCETLLQSKLYTIDKALSKLDVSNKTYGKDAVEIQKSIKSFETKV